MIVHLLYCYIIYSIIISLHNKLIGHLSRQILIIVFTGIYCGTANPPCTAAIPKCYVHGDFGQCLNNALSGSLARPLMYHEPDIANL